MTHTCRRCEQPKSVDEMCMRAGKISKVCKTCYSAAVAAAVSKKAGKKSKKKAEPKPKRAVKDPPPIKQSEAPPSMRIEAGYGLDASIDDGYLKLSQADHHGAVETLMLSRSEAILLFARFADWVNA